MSLTFTDSLIDSIYLAGGPCTGYRILAKTHPDMTPKELSELLKMYKTGLIEPSLLKANKAVET